MKCPFCGHLEDKVVDSREGREGLVIRRRRECLECSRRFTSYERIDEIPIMVIKKDGKRREPYDRNKVLGGLRRACEKRPISPAELERVADEVERMLQETSEREIPTEAIGQTVMDRLRDLDKVAYVRFASVYREFQDVDQFMLAVRGLFEKK